MFGFLKKKLKKIYDTVTTKLHILFTQATVDEQTLKELETISKDLTMGTPALIKDDNVLIV